VYVTRDIRRGVLLLRGVGAEPTVTALSLPARRSTCARGWVVDVERLADVLAFAQYRRELAVVSERKAATS
jgi:hypothetical protein